ncbi:MAG: (2Fe-2S)-binding protein [Spirochaetia bacterium]
MNIQFSLNSKAVSIQAAADTRLLTILRENFGLIGTKGGCYCGTCGQCTILMNNQLVYSCLIPAFLAKGTEVMTIEGFSLTKDYQDIERALSETNISLCANCAPGRVLSIHALLEEYPKPDMEQIHEALESIVCRCSGSSALFDAVQTAGEIRRRRNRGSTI